MLSALVASAGNKSFVEAARRTVRFPPSEGVGRENRKEESCVDKVEKVEQCGGRRKILGGRKNNGDTRGKGIGFFGIDEEGASRSSLDTVLRGLIVGIRCILWFLSMDFFCLFKNLICLEKFGK